MYLAAVVLQHVPVNRCNEKMSLYEPSIAMTTNQTKGVLMTAEKVKGP